MTKSKEIVTSDPEKRRLGKTTLKDVMAAIVKHPMGMAQILFEASRDENGNVVDVQGIKERAEEKYEEEFDGTGLPPYIDPSRLMSPDEMLLGKGRIIEGKFKDDSGSETHKKQ